MKREIQKLITKVLNASNIPNVVVTIYKAQNHITISIYDVICDDMIQYSTMENKRKNNKFVKYLNELLKGGKK